MFEKVLPIGKGMLYLHLLLLLGAYCALGFGFYTNSTEDIGRDRVKKVQYTTRNHETGINSTF